MPSCAFHPACTRVFIPTATLGCQVFLFESLPCLPPPRVQGNEFLCTQVRTLRPHLVFIPAFSQADSCTVEPKRLHTTRNTVLLVYRSEGVPRTGYFIPVRDEVRMGDVGKFFRCRRRRRRRRPPQVGVCWLPFPSRMGSRIEISGHPSEHPAQNCAMVLLFFNKKRKNAARPPARPPRLGGGAASEASSVKICS